MPPNSIAFQLNLIYMPQRHTQLIHPQPPCHAPHETCAFNYRYTKCIPVSRPPPCALRHLPQLALFLVEKFLAWLELAKFLLFLRFFCCFFLLFFIFCAFLIIIIYINFVRLSLSNSLCVCVCFSCLVSRCFLCAFLSFCPKIN